MQKFGENMPTRPGTYWFHSETASREMLVEVRLSEILPNSPQF